MRWNVPLSYIAICYSLVNILFYWHASTMTGGTSLIYVIIYPAFWILSALIIGILCYWQRKSWLAQNLKNSTYFLLLFCTPLPFFLFASLMQPEMTRSSSSYLPRNGLTYKSENWNYSTGEPAAKKIWKLKTENWIDVNEDEFLKDSVWVYFNKNGDTIKIETYKDDKLIKIKNFN